MENCITKELGSKSILPYFFSIGKLRERLGPTTLRQIVTGFNLNVLKLYGIYISSEIMTQSNPVLELVLTLRLGEFWSQTRCNFVLEIRECNQT